MGAIVLTALAVAALQVPSDTAVYASPATRLLVERAMLRHAARDSGVTDYQALIRYRLSFGMGRRRWARTPVAAVEEQEARVAWQQPNDVRVDVLGRRVRAVSSGLRPSSVFDRPWFVPRGVGDSIRVFSDDVPAIAPLHPLAADAPAWYRYAVVDSLAMEVPRAGRLRLIKLDVVPRRPGPALVAGSIWVDAASAEVVRFTFRYVGTSLWVDPEADDDGPFGRERANAIINRILTLDADLEYALVEGRHWLPYRQVLSGHVRIPIVSDAVIQFQAVTTFRDYAVNSGRPVRFDLPAPGEPGSAAVYDSAARQARRDSLQADRQRGEGRDRPFRTAGVWPGGRYEIHRPADDSLADYAAWGDSLELDLTPEESRRIRSARAELARMAEDLPDELTGARAHAFAYQRLTDALRYDRVQGLSLGAGYRLRLPTPYTDLYATLRYGFSDDRVTGRLAVVRDAPGGRLTLAAYRDVEDPDPFGAGGSFANSFDALFTTHDDADYYLAHGGSAGFETSLRTGLELRFGVRAERQESVTRRARSSVNDALGGDGRFPENPPIAGGTFGGAWAGLRGVGAIDWELAADVLAGEGRSTARLYGTATRTLGGARGVSLRLRAGAATSPVLPQSAFRVGGQPTVRGFPYGAATGQAMWALQADWAPLGGALRPVLFLDAGQAGPLDGLSRERVLVGGGVGLSLYSRLLRSGVLRLDLSRPLSPGGDRKLRVDLFFGSPR